MADVAEPPVKSDLQEALKKAALVDLGKGNPDAAAKPPEPPQKPPADKPVTPPTTEGDWADKVAPAKNAPTSKDWDKLKGERNEFRQKYQEAEPKLTKVSEYEKELAELRKHPRINADEIKKLTEERDDYKSQVEVVALEFMPEFHQKYQARIDKSKGALKESLPSDVFAKVEQYLESPQNDSTRRALADLTENMDEFQKMEIGATLREIRNINGERVGELANAKNRLGEIVATRTKAQKDREAADTKTFEDTFERAAKENPLFKKREGDSKEVREWNDSIAERKEVAMQVFRGSLEPGQMAEAALAVSSTHVLVGELKAAAGRVAELEAVVKQLQGSGPSLDGDGKLDKAGGAKSLSTMLGERIAKGR